MLSFPTHPAGRRSYGLASSTFWGRKVTRISLIMDTYEEYVSQNLSLQSHVLPGAVYSQCCQDMAKKRLTPQLYDDWRRPGQSLGSLPRRESLKLRCVQPPQGESTVEYQKRLSWSSLDKHIQLWLHVIPKGKRSCSDVDSES